MEQQPSISPSAAGTGTLAPSQIRPISALVLPVDRRRFPYVRAKFQAMCQVTFLATCHHFCRPIFRVIFPVTFLLIQWCLATSRLWHHTQIRVFWRQMLQIIAVIQPAIRKCSRYSYRSQLKPLLIFVHSNLSSPEASSVNGMWLWLQTWVTFFNRFLLVVTLWIWLAGTQQAWKTWWVRGIPILLLPVFFIKVTICFL